MTRGYRYPIEYWLQSSRGRALADRVRLHLYEEIPVHGELPAGTWIFSDIERLGPFGRELAVRLRNALAVPGAVEVLNDPTVALDRFPLLAELSARGVNRFRAFRALDTLPSDLRYPVFVRMERHHGGSLTPLLRDRRALEVAIRTLTSPFRGYRRRDLLVVEFVDMSDREGVFNRYTAFRVGDRILPRHADFSWKWSLNGERQVDAATAQADADYVDDNPHGELLRPIFEVAHIDYGRVDYSVRQGEIQVWEVNTNPMIGSSGPPGRKLRLATPHAATRPGRDRFHGTMREALKEIDRDSGDERVEVRLPAPLVARARAERAHYLRMLRYRRWMKGVRRAATGELATVLRGGP